MILSLVELDGHYNRNGPWAGVWTGEAGPGTVQYEISAISIDGFADPHQNRRFSIMDHATTTETTQAQIFLIISSISDVHIVSQLCVQIFDIH